MFVVIDVDGTLADNTHRAHFLKDGAKNMEAYLAAVEVAKDSAFPEAVRVVAKLQELKYDIVILSERPEALRDTTMRWLLAEYALDIPETQLLMRPTGNMLGDLEGKREQFGSFMSGIETRRSGFIFIDDNPAVCASMELYGHTLLAPKCWETLFPKIVPA